MSDPLAVQRPHIDAGHIICNEKQDGSFCCSCGFEHEVAAGRGAAVHRPAAERAPEEARFDLKHGPGWEPTEADREAYRWVCGLAPGPTRAVITPSVVFAIEKLVRDERATERETIRLELLKLLEEESYRIEGWKCGQEGCNLPEHAGHVVSIVDLRDFARRLETPR